jgi:MYXO-CTERM domain-containing protein
VLPAVLLVVASAAAGAQPSDLTVEAPVSLEPIARRIREMDPIPLAKALETAGLPAPRRVRIALIAGDDPRIRRLPEWIVGFASGTEDIVILTSRIGSYPYGSIESVVRHEIVHLALNTRAGGQLLPRWFHEGVAVTVVSGWGSRDQVHLLLAALERPSMADLSRLFASDLYPDTAQAYLLSAALLDDVRRRHGNASPGAIAGAVAAGEPFEAAFLTVTGERVEDVAARAWAGHRRLTRWIPIATSPSSVWTLILAVAALAFVFRLRRRREQHRRWEEEEEEEVLEDEPTDEIVDDEQ